MRGEACTFFGIKILGAQEKCYHKPFDMIEFYQKEKPYSISINLRYLEKLVY